MARTMKSVDAVMVGMGWTGAIMARELSKAGLTVVGLERGEKPDAIGPNLKGVYDRKSAALDDFRYSNPMKRANLVWDGANLRGYLLDPQAKVKGNRMPFGGVANPSDAD